jgi:hypothetical protein
MPRFWTPLYFRNRLLSLLALIKKRRNLNVGRDAIGGERSGTGRSIGCDDHKRRIAKGPMPPQASGV